MTTKKIKTSDILGDNYYIYELTSSNYTPALNGTITITCTMKDVYGAAASSKSITLYQNGTSKGTQTTNSSGVATWSITCSTAGLQKFNIKDTSIEVFVDNKSNVDHTHSNYVTTSDSRLSDARTPTSHTHGNLQNNGQVGSTAQANKNVVTNSSGLITTEDKPTIPSKTSQLTNDSGFLTSHQSLDSKTVTVEKLATAESGYLSSYAVKQNGVQVGNTINIPKDFLVKSGSVKTVSTANNPVSGYSVGDKYIDLVINVQEGTSTDSHIYILVSDLIDTPVAISDVTGLQSALNDFELVALKTDDISQLTSNTEYYPSAKGVADYVDYIIPLTNLSDFNDDLNYITEHQSLTNYVQKSLTTGLIKNDGTIMSGGTGSSNYAIGNHTHSEYLTSHQDISGKLDKNFDFYNASNWTTMSGNNPSITSNNVQANSISLICLNKEFIEEEYYTLTFTLQCTNADRQGFLLFGDESYNPMFGVIRDVSNTFVEQYDTNGDATLVYTGSKNYFTTGSHTINLVRENNSATLYIDNELFYTFSNIGNYLNTLGLRKWGSSNIAIQNITVLSNFSKNIVDIIYPIGAIYMSINNINPSILFGGVWEQIEDRFLLASGSSYSAGSTGGSADATLVSHQHGTSESREYFVTSESNDANNTKVSYSASGNRYVDGMTTDSTPFHHRVGTGYVGVSATGKNMPPYLTVYMWKRIA